MEQKKWKISFCIVCANRLHHLKETLLKNITDNEDYEDLEFILLDYNSKDAMGGWVKEELQPYLSTGKLTYYRTLEPEIFDHSHSKNVAFKLAKGEIVCNINADHYMGKGFAHFVNRKFNENNNIVLTPIGFHEEETDFYPAQDVNGKVCVRKSDFEMVKGFDERMKQYGFEDHDFVYRLQLSGVKKAFIDDRSFLEFISHEEKERYTLNAEDIKHVYSDHITPSVSEVIILYKNGEFEKGTITDYTTLDAENHVYAYQPRSYTIPFVAQNGEESGWLKGTWEFGNGMFVLTTNAGDEFSYREDIVLSRLITDVYVIEVLLRLRMYYHNRYVMEANLEQKGINVNPDSFGKTTVFKNFDYSSGIVV